MRYSTRVLLLQLGTVVAVVAVCTGIFSWLAYDRIKDEAATSATAIARTVAESPQVRARVAEDTAEDAGPNAAVSSTSELQAYSVETAQRTGALFVVITDSEGIRLAHPDPARIGEKVSTDHEAALSGQEVTAWESGTLGPSARAKVPVYAPGTSTPVGEVSVGFRRSSAFSDLPRLLTAVGIGGAAALLLGLAASMLMRRRWERVTLGLQPEELTELVRAQAAVLDGVGDGVMSLDDADIVRLVNTTASQLLSTDSGSDTRGTNDELDAGRSLVGRHITELGLPENTASRLMAGEPCDQVIVGNRVLYLDVRPVMREGRALGSVVVVRDRTDIADLSRRLGSVQAMGQALRVQRHEFANRVHVASGLLDAGRTVDARSFLTDMVERGPVDFPLENAELLTEPFLQSFLGAKSAEASERGVALRIGEDTLVLDTVNSVGAVEDIATVLGNLVDNALVAAARTADQLSAAWVEVTVLQDEDSLTLVVADSGPGWQHTATRTDHIGDEIHGHGIGLALSRDLVRRRGGELWIIDHGGKPGRGAVVGVRLPEMLTPLGVEHDRQWETGKQ